MLLLPVYRWAVDAVVLQESEGIGLVNTGLERAVTHYQAVIVTCLPGILFTGVFIAFIFLD